MLKLKVSGTKNDLKSFRKWITRAMVILPKYKIETETDFEVKSRDGKYYHWEADLLKPLYEKGGIYYVQNNSSNQSKGRRRENGADR